MNTPRRWNYKLLEVKPRLLRGRDSATIETDINRLGNQGWELVSITQDSRYDKAVLYFKQPAS